MKTKLITKPGDNVERKDMRVQIDEEIVQKTIETVSYSVAQLKAKLADIEGQIEELQQQKKKYLQYLKAVETEVGKNKWTARKTIDPATKG